MRKCWKWIIGLVVLLLVGLLIWFLINFYYYSTKRLPPWEKEKVEWEYYEVLWSNMEEARKYNPLIWYEDNDYVEEEHVWRYIGTYGDCHAFLVIGDNINVFGWRWEGPYPIEGLSRVVEYPTNEARIMLYHTKKAFTYAQFAQIDIESDNLYKMRYLNEIRNREEWLTDAQFEQLTLDVEKLAEQQA